MIKFVLVILTCVLPTVAHAAVGRVSEQTGTAVEIRRGNSSISGQQNTSIESMDTVVVGSRAETNITFQDNTRVKIKENSRLVIDNFVFDPGRSDAGRMAMRVTLGTVQYTSGQIAKNNRQNLNITTPTATVAVRGTDMAMSVDEIGRSFVVLLPSCRNPSDINRYEVSGNCTVGAVDVITSAGSVSLTQPFTATYVTDANQQPLPPVKIDANIATISNDLAMRKPQSIVAAEAQRQETKEAERNKSQASGEEQRAASSSSQNTQAVAVQQTTNTATTISVPTTSVDIAKTPELPTATVSSCFPFDTCATERGRTNFYRRDETRNNIISVTGSERGDNTTYSISINDNTLQSLIVGDGSSRVTIRIWNR